MKPSKVETDVSSEKIVHDFVDSIEKLTNDRNLNEIAKHLSTNFEMETYCEDGREIIRNKNEYEEYMKEVFDNAVDLHLDLSVESIQFSSNRNSAIVVVSAREQIKWTEVSTPDSAFSEETIHLEIFDDTILVDRVVVKCKKQSQKDTF